MILSSTDAPFAFPLEIEMEATERRAQWVKDARPAQLTPPGDWDVWLIKAGRGFGKTRSGGEDAWWYAFGHAKSRTAVISATLNDVRKTCYEGESGLLEKIPTKLIKSYNKTLLEITLLNGSILAGYSSEEPERLRGPQFHRAWCDELAAWANIDATWDNLQFALRLGVHPQAIVTTTPKPVRLIKEMMKGKEYKVALSTGSTYENMANLPKTVLERLRRKYEGTRVGRQELRAELLEDIVGALWDYDMIGRNRLSLFSDKLPQMSRIIVAVDPPAKTEGAECGIIVAGRGMDGRGYVLRDDSFHASPADWGAKVVACYHEFKADRVVVETNNGGEMATHVITSLDPMVPVRAVTASRGKITRAEPVSSLYEQNRVSHVGPMPELESQMCEYVAGSQDSPDRMDALVWALSDLMLSSSADAWIDHYANIGKEMAGAQEAAIALSVSAGNAAKAKENELDLIYASVYRSHVKPTDLCARCGTSVGGARVTDGVSLWHPGCFQ